jgi:hypothetical protein
MMRTVVTKKNALTNVLMKYKQMTGDRGRCEPAPIP